MRRVPSGQTIVERPAFREALSRGRGMIAGVTLAGLLGSAVLMGTAPPQYAAQARLMVEASGSGDLLDSQMQVIGSRELARRVIERLSLAQSAAFDPAQRGLLSFLGVTQVRAAGAPDEALLDLWFSRLTLAREDAAPVVRIQFEAPEPALAARIANGVAETFVQMQSEGLQARASAQMAQARVLARATVPNSPSSPLPMPMIAAATLLAFLAASGAALAQAAFATPARKPARQRVSSVPEELPQFHPARVEAAPAPAQEFDSFVPDPHPMTVLVERVSSAARGDQALRVLVTSARTPCGEIALSLGRALAQQRPVILIDLASRAQTRADQPPGLDALLMGVATFDEAIHLDEASRLHLLTCGLQETRPGSALDIVLQALAHTYEVVILAVPSLSEGDLASGLARDVDVTVLACPGSASDPASSAAYRDLKTAGAGTIFAFSHEAASDSRRDRPALYQRPSIHLMSGMTGSTQASPATT